MPIIPPTEHARIIATIIEQQFAEWDTINARHQRRVWKHLGALLNKYPLDLMPSGLIRPSGANLRKIATILRHLEKTIRSSAYLNSISVVMSSYGLLESANKAYYGEMIRGFADKPVYRILREVETDRVLAAIAKTPFREALYNPIKNLLIQHTTSGGDFLDMVELLSSNLLDQTNAAGDVVRAGYLKNYHWRQRITRDALFGYNRAYNETVANVNGMDWFYYSGGLVRDSRNFCRSRNEKYWHRKEIESWAKIPKKRWPEKIPGTNKNTIFINLGGWNCRHSLLPVSQDRVPESQIQRAIKKGFIKREPA